MNLEKEISALVKHKEELTEKWRKEIDEKRRREIYANLLIVDATIHVFREKQK